MILALTALISGLLLLVWSADRFVEGSVSTAHHFGMPSLLIGMVIVGFGTSAPEMIVSAISASQGNPGIALGNAYGSNITNIALILGLTSVLSPITVHSQILRKELPLLAAATALTIFLLWDLELSRIDSAILIVLFAVIMIWTIIEGIQKKTDVFGTEIDQTIISEPVGKALLQLFTGLITLIISSRILVWGAVTAARLFGVNDLVIGLTIVAVGTSLPELASSIAAARKKEHDIALGNVLGSNLFNTLTVTGIAGIIHPLEIESIVMRRDIPLMTALTLSLFIIGYGFRGPGRINRLEGSILLLCYTGYNIFLISGIINP